MCCSDAEKGRIEEVVLASLRCGESRVLEHILDKILDRRKLIDWKVSSSLSKESRFKISF